MIDAFATRIHCLNHLLPVWEALPPEHRGTLYVSGHLVASQQANDAGTVPKNMTLLSVGPRVLVASQLDYQTVATHRRVVYMNHGAGQSYGGDSDPGVSRASSYAGGNNQESTDLFLVPGSHPAQRCRGRYPHVPVVEIGCPMLDRWLLDPPPPAREPIVALAWHWENQLCPETRSALPHFRSALPDLAERYAVIGHGHPRARDLAQSVYEPLGIPWVDYDTAMALASVVVVDNSSFGFEAAALGKSVVWMTPPWYRRDVDHGLRFGPDFYSQGHVEVETPENLLPAVEFALNHPSAVDLSGVYTYLDGRSAERAAQAIVALETEAEPMRPLAEVTP